MMRATTAFGSVAESCDQRPLRRFELLSTDTVLPGYVGRSAFESKSAICLLRSDPAPAR